MGLKSPAKLAQKREEYEALLAFAGLVVGIKRVELSRARNRQQYLKRCIKSINNELQDRKDGQLVLDLD